MKLRELKAEFLHRLTPVWGTDEAQSIFYILLEEFEKLRRIDAALQPDFQLSEASWQRWQQAITRLLNHEPVQYLIGYTEFMGLNFSVAPGVLIPRPETEELVEWILQDYPDSAGVKLLDVGTGSGCIPISIKHFRSKWEVNAMDVSDQALQQAQFNAQELNQHVNWIQTDVLQPISFPAELDVVVSNPPYVRPREKSEMLPNVLMYEPELALFIPEEDPLLFYREIGQKAWLALKSGGRLYYEINQYLAVEMQELLQSLGYEDIQLRTDFRGQARMMRATRP